MLQYGGNSEQRQGQSLFAYSSLSILENTGYSQVLFVFGESLEKCTGAIDLYLVKGSFTGSNKL